MYWPSSLNPSKPHSLIAFVTKAAALLRTHGRLEPAALLIAVCWLVGVWLVNRARRGLPWHDSSGTAPGGQEKPRGHSKALCGFASQPIAPGSPC